MEDITYEYRIKVWDNKHNQYIGWGDSYNNKELCLFVYEDYLRDCLDINKKYPENKYYINQYLSYTSKPIILEATKIITKYEKLENEYIEIKGNE